MVEDNPVYSRKLLKIFTHKIKRPERMKKFKDFMFKKQDDSDWEEIDKKNLMRCFPLMEQHDYWD